MPTGGSLAKAAVVDVSPAYTDLGELDGLAEPSVEELAIARALVRSAGARGAAMTGPKEILKALTKTVSETALTVVRRGLRRTGRTWESDQKMRRKVVFPVPPEDHLGHVHEWRHYRKAR